jgi:hypothetical protein
MSGKHRKTLEAIVRDPVQANIAWTDVVALFEALGARGTQGSGSRAAG